jgi:hypothetical protein
MYQQLVLLDYFQRYQLCIFLHLLEMMNYLYLLIKINKNLQDHLLFVLHFVKKCSIHTPKAAGDRRVTDRI